MQDVSSSLQQARAMQGRALEISWVRPGSEVVLCLSVQCRPEGGDPIWVLTEGEYREAREIWTYASGDLTLIYNLVMSESAGDTMAAAEQTMMSGSFMKISPTSSSAYHPSLFGLQATSGTRIPVVNASKSTKIATMEGDLKDLAIPNLLQSVNMGKMTGRLFVDNGQSAAELFFDDGNLVHAEAMDVQGDQAIMELVTWESGKFYFYRDEATELKTVKRRVDALLMEGITLLDQSKALLKAGLTMETYLDKKNPGLSEAEFEKAVSSGAPVDMALQKAFYLKLEGTSSLFDIFRLTPMVKKDWVPILFNLVNCDLISMSKKPTKVDKTSMLESTAIDRLAIERVYKSLVRQDTGIISYPSFSFFLDQEFQRFQLFRTPFSVIIFEMWIWNNNRLEPLPLSALQQAVNVINSAKRTLDLLAHFEAFGYALLLPNTETPSAAMLAHRIMEMLRTSNLGGGASSQGAALAFGIAGIPEDCRDMGLLLSAAKASKLVAQRNNYPIVMFRDMQAPSQ